MLVEELTILDSYNELANILHHIAFFVFIGALCVRLVFFSSRREAMFKARLISLEIP